MNDEINKRHKPVKVGDLVLNDQGETAILLTAQRYYAGGEFDSAPYYIADVFVTEFSCKEVWITDDVELLSESR